MKKVFFLLSLIFLGLSLISCGKTDTDTDSVVLFQDNFEYAIASPWDLTTPVNGWSSPLGPDNWNIIADDLSGNALRYLGPSISFMVNDYTGLDYKLSVHFKPVKIIISNTTEYPFCLAARLDGSNNNGYAACVINTGSNNIYLDIASYSYDGINRSLVSLASVIVPGAHPLDTGTWYTLTMTLSGSTITGTISGGTLTETTVTTSDTTYSSAGKVGLLVWNNSSSTYDVRFDNFTVSSIATP